MLAAVRAVHRRKPFQTVVAVPTFFASTIKLLGPPGDAIVCPHIRSGYSFFVADAHQKRYDLPLTQVINLLKSRGPLANKSVYLAPIFPDMSHKFISY
jgi:predicted phosphoribosyltransferase